MPTLLYFDIRGRAEPIRMLLSFVDVEYEDVQLTLEDWETTRPATPFRRMPVYCEGTLEIPETYAILNYLGRKHGLMGTSTLSQVRCDVATEAWRDYGNRVANAFGALSNSETARQRFVAEEQPALLADLEAYYLQRDEGSQFWAGNSPTISDFTAFNAIEGLGGQFPDLLEQFAALKSFHRYFGGLPKIEAYLKSAKRPAALFYGPKGKIFPRKDR